MQTLTHSDPSHKDWFIVNWCLGNTCNFNCSYCPDILHDGSTKWPDISYVERFVNKIKTSFPNKKLYFEFTGGEITLYKHFDQLCKLCSDNNIKVGLISNGSRSLRWWEANKKYFSSINLSFHHEYANKDHFIDVVKILHNDLRTHVNIMMDPKNFDYCYDVADTIKDLGNLTISLQPLLYDLSGDLYPYTDEQHQLIKDQQKNIKDKVIKTKRFPYLRGKMTYKDVDYGANELVNSKMNNWNGWNCHIGIEQLIVFLDGKISRGWCGVGGNIGNIFDDKLELPNEPILCNKDWCHCNFDITCTKEKINTL